MWPLAPIATLLTRFVWKPPFPSKDNRMTDRVLAVSRQATLLKTAAPTHAPAARTWVGLCLVLAPLLLRAAPAVLPDDAATKLCVDLINQRRALVGAPPLARWRAGEAPAAEEALEDARSASPHAAMRRKVAMGERRVSAQNECMSSDARLDPMIRVCISSMWGEGPDVGDGRPHGHYVNLSNPRYTRVACGFARAPDGSTWSAQDFAAEEESASRPQLGTPAGVGGPSPVEQIPMSDFERVCLERTNRLRMGLHLAPFSEWSGAATCAQILARAYEAGRAPSPEEKACLGNQSWGLSVCRTDGGGVLQQLEGCIGQAVREGSGPPSDPNHADYAYMASPDFSQEACVYSVGRAGVTTIVRVFR